MLLERAREPGDASFARAPLAGQSPGQSDLRVPELSLFDFGANGSTRTDLRCELPNGCHPRCKATALRALDKHSRINSPKYDWVALPKVKLARDSNRQAH